jgi:hypothetical protein
MNKQKYFESNVLIAQRRGLPNIVQQKLIISDEDKELAKECFLYLRDEIQQRSAGGVTGKSSPVWIPFGQLLAEILPSNKGSDSRNTNRIFALLNIIPLTKAHLRPKLVYGLELLVVATLEDLREVLHITQDVTGMPVYKLRFYKEIFLPLFRSKRAPDVGDEGKIERIIALTSREICNYYNSTKDIRPITVDNLKKTFLDELLNHGYIEQENSAINAKQNIYYPLIDIEDEQSSYSPKLGTPEQHLKENEESVISNLANASAFDKDLQFSRLILPLNCKRISDNWLNLEILELMTYRADPKFKLLDKNGNQLCVCSFVKQYENSLRLSRFIKASQKATSSKIFGDGIKEIATMYQYQHNKKSKFEQFDKKDNSNAMAHTAVDDVIQSASDVAALPLEQGDNNSLRQPYAHKDRVESNHQEHIMEGLQDNSSNSLLRNYVAFDLEWVDESTGKNQTIYAAAFVDNRGNQKVLHISDFANSEPALLQAITDEILKYPASMGWYTTGIGRGSSSNIVRGDATETA